jgi:hypothetical protein
MRSSPFDRHASNERVFDSPVAACILNMTSPPHLHAIPTLRPRSNPIQWPHHHSSCNIQPWHSHHPLEPPLASHHHQTSLGITIKPLDPACLLALFPSHSSAWLLAASFFLTSFSLCQSVHDTHRLVFGLFPPISFGFRVFGFWQYCKAALFCLFWLGMRVDLLLLALVLAPFSLFWETSKALFAV